MKVAVLFTIVVVLIFSSFSYSNTKMEESIEVHDNAETISESHWHIGLGNYFDFPDTYQVNSSGKKNDYSLWPIVNGGITGSPFISNSILFQGNIMLSAPRQVGNSDLTRMFFSIELLPGIRLGNWGSFFTGLSIFEQLLFFKSRGETQTESSSTFYRPDKVTWISQQVFVLSYQTPKIFNSIYSEIKSYTFSLFDESKRQNSYVFNVSYQW